MSKDTSGKTGTPGLPVPQQPEKKKPFEPIATNKWAGGESKAPEAAPKEADAREAKELPEETAVPESKDSDPAKSRRKKKAKPAKSPGEFVRFFFTALLRWKIPVIPLVLFGLPVLVGFWSLAHRTGVAAGVRKANRAAEMEGMQLPPEISRQLNAALLNLREGDSELAEKELSALDEGETKYPALSFLTAVAAMQNGNIELAERKVKESIIKRERISDALALQSVIETQKAADRSRWKSLGDPQKRAENLLRQAILADAANPYPHFELATLLRYQGRRDEAMEEIQAARSRLNPVDSHLLMDVTLALLKIEELPDDRVPRDPPQSDDVRKLFPAAYGAMRLGEFSRAAELLQKCRHALSSDLFDYLVNDPLIRRYADREQLKPFYQY